MPPLVCLTVLSILGIYCYEDATPIGACVNYGDALHCQIEADELPLFLSVYDPNICFLEPTNCSDQSNPWQSATRLLSPADYGRIAACPPGWLYRRLAVPGIPLDVECLDSGGRIHPTFREVWVFDDGAPHTEWLWVIVVDVLWPQGETDWPGWALMKIPEWEIR